jgi:hypothetical protein
MQPEFCGELFEFPAAGGGEIVFFPRVLLEMI